MQNTDQNTKTFVPPEGGFTAEQIVEYEKLKTTYSEWKKYGDAVKCGHPGSYTSIAAAGDGRSFNEIFGIADKAGHRMVFAPTRTGMSYFK